MFWPSAVYRSFGGFCGSLFIVGSGLSTLETSANPFIATCGPPRLSEFRLELSQSFQAIGSVMAPLLASRVFFENTDPNDISKVQWTYLGIAGFVFLLAVVFFFAPSRCLSVIFSTPLGRLRKYKTCSLGTPKTSDYGDC